MDDAIGFDRQSTLSTFKFDSLFANPHMVGARLESFAGWKARYVQAYRKAHRAYHESLGVIAKSAEGLRPRAIALNRLNAVVELGPPLAGTANVSQDLQRHESAAWVCPDGAEADVAEGNACCSKCHWTPATVLPQAEHERLMRVIEQGLADRIQRLKDASIAAILKKAAEEGRRPDLGTLIEIIHLADADRLAAVITDDLAAFLRTLLQEANIVHETIALGPILARIGAIEEERVEEKMAELVSLVTKAIKDAKARHGTGKRVRVSLSIGDPGTESSGSANG